jgi:hypothetical protein
MYLSTLTWGKKKAPHLFECGAATTLKELTASAYVAMASAMEQ